MASKQATRRKAAKQSANTLDYRAFAVRSESLNVEGRTIDTVITTEAPVPMMDWERWEVIPEVLLTSGMQAPESRQVPMLDSHQRGSTDTQIGSARAIRSEGDQVIGTLHFSSTAEEQWTKVREGHVTDVSAGYQVLQRTFIPKGTTQVIQGRSYSGPVNVVTKWKLREVSLTPIGADEQAKLRGFDPTALNADEEIFSMNPELRKLLESRGMPATLNDDEAQKWVVENPGKLVDKDAEGREAPATIPFDPKMIEQAAERAAAAAVAKAVQVRNDFRKEVDDLLEIADLSDEAQRCYSLGSLDKVREHIKTVRKERSEQHAVSPTIRVTGEGKDRFLSDIGTQLTLRAMNDAVPAVDERTRKIHEDAFPVAQRGKNADQFRHATLYQMAEEFVRMNGINPIGLTREQVAICAMFGPERADILGRDAGAYHTTGNFTKLTQDAVNKSMQVGYTEAPSTWEGPMRIGQDAQDFKTIHRVRMGAIPNLPIWNDTKEPEKASFADADETYAVESYSLGIDFSYRLLVNDDMSALGRTPGQMGASARRTVNAVAWSQITANPTMSDSIALFSAVSGARKRQNLTTGAGAPSVTTVGALTNLMRQMRGENTPEGNESADVLNIQPRYIVGPSALEVTINQLVNSAYDPNASINTQVYNPTRVLIPVIEPLLDASSTTAWYLFASPSQIDTVEVTFLAGQRSPIVRQEMDFEKLSQKLYVLQTFAAKALNHRGIQKHAGA